MPETDANASSSRSPGAERMPLAPNGGGEGFAALASTCAKLRSVTPCTNSSMTLR